MIPISDPFLRKLVEDALRGGNTSLAQDLEPGRTILPRAQAPSFDPGLGGAEMMRAQSPLPGGTPPPRGPQPSLIDRMLSGIYVPPAPSMHGYEKNRTSRMFLSGLTGAIAKNHQGAGYGSGILWAVGGRNAGGGGGGAYSRAPQVEKVDPLLDLKRALLEAQIKSTGSLGGQRDARTAEINEPDAVDPLLGEKRRWWEERISAEGRRNRNTGGAGSRGGGKGSGGKPLTMAQKRAQINALAQAEKQRVANNIKNKYREVYDYNNPMSGRPEGKRIVDAAIARGIAQVEQEHARVLRELGAEYGMQQGENAPAKASGGKSTLDLLNEK